MMRRMNAHVDGEQGEPASPEEPAAEPEATPDEPVAEAAAEEPVAAEVEPPKVDDRLELKHARALSRITELESKHVSVKQERDQLKSQNETFVAKVKANPIALIEEISGIDFPTLMKRAADGEFDKQRHSELPPELQAKIDKLAKFEEQETARRATESKAAERAADTDYVKRTLGEMASEFPMLLSNAFGDGAEEIVDRAYKAIEAGKKPNVVAIAKEMEAEVAKSLKGYLTNPQLLALLESDKEVRDTIAKAFGGLSEPKKSPVSDPRTATPAPKPANARTLPNSTEIPSRSEKPEQFASRDEETAESVRLMAQWLKTGQI